MSARIINNNNNNNNNTTKSGHNVAAPNHITYNANINKVGATKSGNNSKQIVHSESPQVWGPRVWKEIHKKSLGLYKGVLVCDFVQYLESLKTTLPCETCREHYIKMLEENPPKYADLSSSMGAFAYTVKLHNLVNKRLGKNILTVEEALRLY